MAGQNIYPAEVEACLLQHPDIRQVSVFGTPDRKLGEIVAARIVSETGQDIVIESLRAFCVGKIAHYKVPSTVEFVSSL